MVSDGARDGDSDNEGGGGEPEQPGGGRGGLEGRT